MLLQKEIERILPVHVLHELQMLKEPSPPEEIRLRTGRPAQVIYMGEEGFATTPLKRQDIYDTLLKACNYSIFAHQKEISQGYITIENGHRIGVCGTAHPGENEKETYFEYTSLNIRIAKQIFGCAQDLLPFIVEHDCICNTLFVSAPRCGKTTMLRDLILLLSNEKEKKVCVADERGELCCFGQTSEENGLRTDCITGMKKARAMSIFIRTMSPDVIVTDELGAPEDNLCVLEAARSGVSVIASVHSDSVQRLKDKLSFQTLWQNKVFDRYILLNRKSHPGQIQAVYDGALNVLWKEGESLGK